MAKGSGRSSVRVSLAKLAPFAWTWSLVVSSCNVVSNQERSASMLHSDSGISRTDYDSIVTKMKDYQEQYPELVQYFEYGRSVQNRVLMGIRVARSDVHPNAKIPAVLISEGIHGNEYLNITDRLPSELLSANSSDGNANTGFKEFLKRGGVVYFVPVVNPDGYANGQRENATGADLNRDFSNSKANFSAFKQVETKAIASFVASEQKKYNFTLEASMEYHCCIGGLIHPNAYTRTPLPTDVLARHQQVGDIVKSVFNSTSFKYGVGTVHTLLDYPETLGGSDDYYLATYGRRAFSFEGRERYEQQNLPKHVKLWNEVFSLINKDYADLSGETSGATKDAFLALGEPEASDQKTTVYVSVSASVQDPLLCLGKKEECTGNSAKMIGLSFVKASADRRFFKTNSAQILSSSDDIQFTVLEKSASTVNILGEAALQAH